MSSTKAEPPPLPRVGLLIPRNEPAGEWVSLFRGIPLRYELQVVQGAENLASLSQARDWQAALLACNAGASAGILPGLVASARQRATRARILALSDDATADHVVSCLRAGANDFLSLAQLHLLPERLDRLLARPAPSAPLDTRFKIIADSVPALVWITDGDGAFIHFNQAWREFTGHTIADDQDEGWFSCLFPDERPGIVDELHGCFRRRNGFRIEFRLRRYDGVYRWMLCQCVPRFENEGQFAGFIGSCIDTSEQHEAQTLLAYRAITQTALAEFGRFALDQHPIKDLLQEATRLICDTLRLHYSEFFALGDSPAFLPLATHGFDAGFQHRPSSTASLAEGDHLLFLDEDAARFPGGENHAALQIHSGLAAPVNDGRRTIGFITGLSIETRDFGRETVDFIRAVANILSTVHQHARVEAVLHESEQKLLQSQKMEAVGLLAGGVAHDFNNLLTAVRCYGDMLHQDLAEMAPELQAKTSEILKATARASALTRQLLAFSRKQILQPEVLDMNGVISDLQDLIRSLLSESVTLKFDITSESACFEADRNQIDQVVLNLCLNARDAMPQGGLLTLSVNTIVITGPNPGNLEPGRYVELIVSDTGIGIAPEVQAQLFQPFFTTKPVGRGTGLGLATCAVIVKNCQGSMSFESELGHGARFHLYLPQIEAPASDFSREDHSDEISGNEHILVVEDDEAIRQITHDILDALGYRVTLTEGSKEALELYETLASPDFDLLLTDVIMPEMNGVQLAEIVRRRHQPGLRIMFMSGYVGNTETVRRVQEHNLPFLEKPFTMTALARKVRETLDAPAVAEL